MRLQVFQFDMILEAEGETLPEALEKALQSALNSVKNNEIDQMLEDYRIVTIQKVTVSKNEIRRQLEVQLKLFLSMGQNGDLDKNFENLLDKILKITKEK